MEAEEVPQEAVTAFCREFWGARSVELLPELVDKARSTLAAVLSEVQGQFAAENVAWTKGFPDDRLVAARLSCGHVKVAIRNMPDPVGLTTGCQACGGEATVVREITRGGQS